eukprot:CAMPEP_0115426850 /NCGR_PEP_ID=MMETSP0271-20121206/29130_1 /TAXON_ID=71861 /ORGANISM="Scrippsiella trochoidea, Strain CCMP3099" /LENGTH=40 /DNA_ID= /DNA_START= /DNA_END= /DNA_ORIENTATION=
MAPWLALEGGLSPGTAPGRRTDGRRDGRTALTPRDRAEVL